MQTNRSCSAGKQDYIFSELIDASKASSVSSIEQDKRVTDWSLTLLAKI